MHLRESYSPNPVDKFHCYSDKHSTLPHSKSAPHRQALFPAKYRPDAAPYAQTATDSFHHEEVRPPRDNVPAQRLDSLSPVRSVQAQPANSRASTDHSLDGTIPPLGRKKSGPLSGARLCEPHNPKRLTHRVFFPYCRQPIIQSMGAPLLAVFAGSGYASRQHPSPENTISRGIISTVPRVNNTL
jgi:hypothetical protein